MHEALGHHFVMYHMSSAILCALSNDKDAKFAHGLLSEIMRKFANKYGYDSYEELAKSTIKP